MVRVRRLSGVGALGFSLLFAAGCGGRAEVTVPPPPGAMAPPAAEVECDSSPCVRQIASGNAHVCGRLDDGSVRCWGLNESGRTGVDEVPLTPRPAPVRLAVRAESIRVGGATSCALASGHAYCWGYNSDANLGPAWNQHTPHPEPTALPLSDLVDVGLGDNFLCTLGSSGEVDCIGIGAEVGLGTAAPDIPRLAELPGLKASSLSVGSDGTCAALIGGGVSCWGDNTWLALGPRLDPPSPDGVDLIRTPRPVPELGQLRSMTLWLGFGCALAASGRVACWGTSLLGEAGNPINGPYWPPVEVKGSDGLKGLAVHDSVCGVDDGGEVKCWGGNVGGQLGSGSADTALSDIRHPVPTLVPGVTGAVSVTLGGDFACALTRTGHVFCWGSNQFGQLGLGAPDAAYHVATEVEW